MADEPVIASTPDYPHVLNEASLVQNTALGAISIWRFVAEFQKQGGAPCILPLCFLVVPIIFHHITLDAAKGTNPSSSLGKFVEKFSANREELLAIHDRMLALRGLTLRSLFMANAQELIAILPEGAAVVPLRTSNISKASVPESVRPIIRTAEKLGGWCASLTVAQISNQLRVFF